MLATNKNEAAAPLEPATKAAAFRSTPVTTEYRANTAIPVTDVKSRSQIQRKLAADMIGHWLGPMPVDDFLAEFLPCAHKQLPTFSDNVLHGIATHSTEVGRYDHFINAIEAWIPDMEAVNTSGHAGDKHLKPDICIYNRGGNASKGVDFARLELWIEVKRGSEVAFRDVTTQASARFPAIQQGTFTPETVAGQEIRGQLANYAGAHHGHQFRHFSFSILITNAHLRFLRWDPAGTIVSASFKYDNNPTILAEFFWRFNHLSAKERGHDISVRPIAVKPDVAKRVRDKLEVANKEEQLFEYHLPGLTKRGHAYSPQPISQNQMLVSRCTRSLPVLWIPGPSQATTGTCAQCAQCESTDKLDATTAQKTEIKLVHGRTLGDIWAGERIVYLKDTWRFLSSSAADPVVPEHEVYAQLIEKGTPNIPNQVVGGDVDGGLTRTQEFMNSSWVCIHPRVSPFHHYRLVVDVVGFPLTTFECTKQLVSTVLDALKAFAHASKVVGILHRDISPGNIIRAKNGQGLLIDWELAKEIGRVGCRRPDRTGTWQFMSANLLRNVGKLHTVADDLESFLHVLGWTTLHFVPAVDTYTGQRRFHDLGIFDEGYRIEEGALKNYEHGGDFKSMLLRGGGYPSEYFKPKQSTPLIKLITTLSLPFRTLYAIEPSVKEDQEYCEVSKQLDSADWFVKTIEAALQDQEEDWPMDDKAVRLPIHRDPEAETQSQQLTRTSQCASELDEWEKSKGFSMGSKRPATPTTPGPSGKRHRNSPAPYAMA